MIENIMSHMISAFLFEREKGGQHTHRLMNYYYVICVNFISLPLWNIDFCEKFNFINESCVSHMTKLKNAEK